MAKQNAVYDDTPMLPGGKWRVHDGDRPQPRVVDPGSTPDAPGRPPSDAVVLFDGTDLSGWVGRDGEAQWKVENGYMEVVGGTGNILSREHFGDCQLHLEWAEPAEVRGDSQGRGNSGVFLMDKYEIQVLDGYDNPTYADGQCGAIYGQYPPLVNPCRPPGEWQSYDIVFEAPRWNADGKLEKPGLHHRAAERRPPPPPAGDPRTHRPPRLGRLRHPPRPGGAAAPAGPRQPGALPQHLDAPAEGVRRVGRKDQRRRLPKT